MLAWDDGYVHAVLDRTAPYNWTDGDDFMPVLMDAWKKGSKETPIAPEKNLEQIFNKNITSAVSLLEKPVDFVNWGDEASVVYIPAEKLTKLQEGSLIKIYIDGTGDYRNFALHVNNWTKVVIEGEVYSQNGLMKKEGKDAGNIEYFSTLSPIYIRLSAADANTLKTGLYVHGMNLTIKDIQIVF